MLCTLMLAARECSWTEEDCERMAEALTLTLMPSQHISDWPRVSSQRLQQRKRAGVQAKQRQRRDTDGKQYRWYGIMLKSIRSRVPEGIGQK
jgi:hypothetical protein